MKCEIHGCEMDYMGEIHGTDQWSCPECIAEEETLIYSRDLIYFDEWDENLRGDDES